MALLTLATTQAQGQNLWGTLVTRYHYHNLGKLMFAFTIFWAYIGFSQFLLIWIANLPEEGPWYLIRMKGAWAGVSIVVAVGQFVIPFIFLLSRNVKMKPKMLALIAIWILAIHFVDLYWMTMPVFYPDGIQFHWTSITAFIGVGGIAVAFAISRARGNFTVPVKDPYLNDSMRYVQP
jgi:prepilin signal peptidase PulO-like enzyme (type II secretory pathway)